MVLTKDKTQSTDPKARVNLITKVVVIIVVPIIHLRNVLLTARPAFLVIKKGHFKQFCRSRQSQGKWKPRQSRCDQHEITSTNNRDQNDDSSWFQFEQDSIQVLFSRGISTDINSKSNIQFDEIDGEGVQCVLTDLTLIKANGPKCSYASTN